MSIKINVNNKKEKLSINEFLISSIFMLAIINYFLAEIFKLYGDFSLTTIVYVIIYVLSCFAILKAVLCRPAFSIMVIATCIMLFLFATFYNKNIVDVMFSNAKTIAEFATCDFTSFFGLCLPPFLLCCCFVRTEKLSKYLINYSKVAVALFCAMMYLQVFKFGMRINYMSIAYNALPSIFFLYYDLKKNKERTSKILYVLGIAFLLIGGCRGAILTLVIFLMLLYIKSFEHFNAKKFFGVFLIIAIIIIIIYNLNYIMQWLQRFLQQFGYSSRLINKMLGVSADGDIFEISDRQRIYDKIKANIKFLPQGLFCDRLLVESYAHNIILEVLIQFGYIFGGLILVKFISIVVKSIKCANKMNDDFLITSSFAFVAILLGQMMVTSSYLTNRGFWLFFGLSIISIYKIRKTKIR